MGVPFRIHYLPLARTMYPTVLLTPRRGSRPLPEEGPVGTATLDGSNLDALLGPATRPAAQTTDRCLIRIEPIALFGDRRVLRRRKDQVRPHHRG